MIYGCRPALNGKGRFLINRLYRNQCIISVVGARRGGGGADLLVAASYMCRAWRKQAILSAHIAVQTLRNSLRSLTCVYRVFKSRETSK